VDPLAAEMPAWSPYSYTFDNPISFIDPDGRAPQSPIFDENGNFLGTDSEGFKGDIVIIPADRYNAWTNNGQRTLDHKITQMVIKVGNPVFGQSLDSYVANDFNLGKKKDRDFLSNVLTNLIDAAHKEELIDYNSSQLKGGKFRIASEGAGAAHYYEVGGKDQITANIHAVSYQEMMDGLFSGGTQSLHFIGNSGDAINILGVHEPLHRKYHGNAGHKYIDPLVQNNRAYYLASDAYKLKVATRIQRMSKY
jgi:hypothetical protein